MTSQKWQITHKIVLVACVILAIWGGIALATSFTSQAVKKTTISPLIWGSNLHLRGGNDPFLTSSTVQHLSQQLHLQMVRIPFQNELAITLKAAKIVKSLGMVPLVVLPYNKKQAALRLVKAIQEVFGKNTVYYEYGNEPDTKGVTSTVYTRSWNTLIPSIKKLAPTGKFIGPALSHADAPYLKQFVAQANPRPDGISWHEYPCDSTTSETDCLARIDQWTTHVADARAAMTGAIGAALPLLITEYNWATLDRLGTEKRSPTFLSAWTEKALQTLIKNEIFAANHSLLVGADTHALITEQESLTGQAQALQKLYALYSQHCSAQSSAPATNVLAAQLASASSVELLTQSFLTLPPQTPQPTKTGQEPLLTIKALKLSFSLPPNATGKGALAIKNGGGMPLAWSAAVETQSQQPWLKLVPDVATLDPGEEMEVTSTLDTRGMLPGNYTGSVKLISNGGSQTLFFQLAVIEPSSEATPTPVPTPVATPILKPQPGATPTATPIHVVSPTATTQATPVVLPPDAPQLPCQVSTVGTTVEGFATVLAIETSPTPISSSAEGCSLESPYGVTTIHADKTLVEQFKQLGICWVRFQLSQSEIETSPGVYNWEKLDTVVKTMNEAGIHIDFPIRCFGGSCFSSPHLPTTQQMTQFATAIAERYNGKEGHGVIEAFEIGNEEYDHFPPDAYGPLLQAGYTAIKKVHPHAIVGMYGTYRPSLTHIKSVMEALTNYSEYFDFANFHYYARGGNPAESTSEHPSYRQVWQLVQSYFPEKLIWVTEVGWPTTPVSCCKPVSPQVQAQYLEYVMDESARSGVIEKVFWFTLNYGTQGNTIYPPSGPLPAFSTFRDYVQKYPLWDTQLGG